MLIDAAADPNVVNDFGIAPLALACTNASAAMVELLLHAGADANVTRPTGETALMTCARSGNVDAVKALLARGANVSASEPARGQTALMWAASQNHAHVVRLLIDSGADVGARTNVAPARRGGGDSYARRAGPESFGFTALLFAVREGARSVVEVLLEKGANIDELSGDSTSVLQVAIATGHWDLAPMLLDRGANPNTDGPGYTPLHWASGSWEALLSGALGAEQYRWMAARGPGKLELVKTLLAHGADPNARLRQAPPVFGYGGGNAFVDLRGATPFVLAGLAADVEVMRALLDAGADPLLTTDDGTNALMTAAGLGQTLGVSSNTYEQALEAAKLVLELGLDVNAVNNAGETALHAAAYFGADPVVRFLVDRGASVNVRNRLGLTPMTVAQGYGGGGGILINPSTVALLRELGGVGDVDMAATPIESIRVACPQPVLYFPLRNPVYGPVFVTTTPQTRFTGGRCEDLAEGTEVRIKGIRETDADKSWDGSVVAREIEIVR